MPQCGGGFHHRRETYEGNALQADAAVNAAHEQVAQAEINFRRTEVAVR